MRRADIVVRIGAIFKSGIAPPSGCSWEAILARGAAAAHSRRKSEASGLGRVTAACSWRFSQKVTQGEMRGRAGWMKS